MIKTKENNVLKHVYSASFFFLFFQNLKVLDAANEKTKLVVAWVSSKIENSNHEKKKPS